MSGAMQMLMSHRSTATSGLNTTAFSATDIQSGVTAEAYAEFNVGGTATLVGNSGTSPASPKWWDGTPSDTWMSYSSTGTGVITGGLTAGTRYQLNATRKLGIQRAALGSVTRTFTVTFFDAATGGNTLGTKTFTATAEFA